MLIQPCIESSLPNKCFKCHLYCPHLSQKQLALDPAIRLGPGSQAVDMAQSPLAVHDRKCLLSAHSPERTLDWTQTGIPLLRSSGRQTACLITCVHDESITLIDYGLLLETVVCLDILTTSGFRLQIET